MPAKRKDQEPPETEENEPADEEIENQNNDDKNNDDKKDDYQKDEISSPAAKKQKPRFRSPGAVRLTGESSKLMSKCKEILLNHDRPAGLLPRQIANFMVGDTYPGSIRQTAKSVNELFRLLKKQNILNSRHNIYQVGERKSGYRYIPGGVGEDMKAEEEEEDQAKPGRTSDVEESSGEEEEEENEGSHSPMKGAGGGGGGGNEDEEEEEEEEEEEATTKKSTTRTSGGAARKSSSAVVQREEKGENGHILGGGAKGKPLDKAKKASVAEVPPRLPPPAPKATATVSVKPSSLEEANNQLDKILETYGLVQQSHRSQLAVANSTGELLGNLDRQIKSLKKILGGSR